MDRPTLPDTSGPDIDVTVEVQHLPTHSSPERQLFTYLITVHNRSDQTWQLMARHWEIVDAGGRETVVDGEGVVGTQPMIPPGGRYTYDSFVTVEATPGRMGGHYVMQDAWGVRAQVSIPPFVLDVPGSRTLH